MARLTKEELDKIKEKYNVSRLWSWSRFNTFTTSKYEYMLKYIKHEKEDRQDCAYAPLGTAAHDTLDAFYENEIKYEDMIGKFNDGWTMAMDIANLKLDRNDQDKHEKLKKKYYDNLVHFFNNHKIYKHNLLIEKPITALIGNNAFIGYIDALYKDDDGVVHIIDFKTSSMYVGKSLEEHSGQLTVYAIGLMQAGIPLEKIKACFNFLKYCTIQYEQKNGAIKTRNVERYKIGESLQSNAKMWLKAFGYDEFETDNYLKLLLDANSIDVLPEEVQEKYTLDDCHVYIPLDYDFIKKWEDYIISTIRDIMLREMDYEKTGSEGCFWDTESDVKAQSYYFATLSGYSAKLHKPYGAYLDKINIHKQESIFCEVGSALKDEEDNISSSINLSNDDIDMSWLDSI